jgi:hypothetical protein
MSMEQILLEGTASGERMVMGRVSEVDAASRTVVVVCDGEAQGRIRCDALSPIGGEALLPTVGERVLVWHLGGPEDRGVVLGRIGPTLAEHHTPELPDTLLLEAKNNITLRVGDGSITIRADGKILIKGKDLVSHAQRVNRIKGGSVAIN